MTVVLDHETHTYTDTDTGATIPGVTGILKDAGVCVFRGVAQQKYLDRGTYIHRATEMIDSGELDWDNVFREYRGWCEAYQGFVDSNRIEILGSEEVVWSESLRYAGTLDRRMVLNGKKTIMDYKSGSPDRYHMVQVCGYGLTFEDYASYEYKILYLKPNGTFALEGDQGTVRAHRAVFRAALTLYHWQQGNLR